MSLRHQVDCFRNGSWDIEMQMSAKSVVNLTNMRKDVVPRGVQKCGCDETRAVNEEVQVAKRLMKTRSMILCGAVAKKLSDNC